LLEEVAEEAPIRYRARAVQYLGSIAHTTGDYKSALPLYMEACRIAASDNWCDPYTTITAQQNIAILKSIDGNHRGSLSDLDKLFPLVRALGKFEPYKHYHYLNSLAVELTEAGRLEEAQNICKAVLASPYAFAYPEWRETGDETALRGYRPPRYVISLSRRVLKKETAVKPDNLLHLPVPQSEHKDSSEKYHRNPFQPKPSVTKIKDWKAKMVKKPNGNKNDDITPKDLDSMTEQDMIVKIFRLSSQEGLTREQLREILENVLKVTKGEN
jgi:tetratricopeptide (TPR) repeat protein